MQRRYFIAAVVLCLAASAAEAQGLSMRAMWEADQKRTVALFWSLFAGGLLMFPVAVFLSYSQSAGEAGNGAEVRLADCFGTPVRLWALMTIAFGLIFWATQAMLHLGYSRRDPGTEISMLAAILLGAALFIGALGMAWGFLLDGFSAMMKGIFILVHYLFTRHPAQAHLPTTASESIARKDFGRAIADHDVGKRGFWRELMTPSFVRRHHLQRAAQVEAQLKADTSILKAAMERESVRSAHADRVK